MLFWIYTLIIAIFVSDYSIKNTNQTLLLARKKNRATPLENRMARCINEITYSLDFISEDVINDESYPTGCQDDGSKNDFEEEIEILLLEDVEYTPYGDDDTENVNNFCKHSGKSFQLLF